MKIEEYAEKVCRDEYIEAINKLNNGNLSHFDKQYWLGKKHAAQDILQKIQLKQVCDETIKE